MTDERREARARYVSACARGHECTVRGRTITVGAPIVIVGGQTYHVVCEPTTRAADAIAAEAAKTVARVDRLEAAGLAESEDIEARDFARQLLA